MKTCTCKGWTWSAYADGPRGENMPACVSCQRAIMRDGYDGQRYFAADMQRKCECSAPVYPKRREYHQVWCASRATLSSGV
jgi:hypothetical protein